MIKIVMKRLSGFSPRPNLTMVTAKEIVLRLFLVHHPDILTVWKVDSWNSLKTNWETFGESSRTLKHLAQEASHQKSSRTYIAQVKLTNVLEVYNGLAQHDNTNVSLLNGNNQWWSYLKEVSQMRTDRSAFWTLIANYMSTYYSQDWREKWTKLESSPTSNLAFDKADRMLTVVEVQRITGEAANFSAPHRKLCIMITLERTSGPPTEVLQWDFLI